MESCVCVYFRLSTSQSEYNTTNHQLAFGLNKEKSLILPQITMSFYLKCSIINFIIYALHYAKTSKFYPGIINHTCTLKQTTQKLQMEKNSKEFQHQAKLVAFQIVWKEPLFNYKKAHTVARRSYMYTLMKNN